jgi:membrane dipeptidase
MIGRTERAPFFFDGGHLMPVIIDSHEDLAYNMLAYDRDYRLSVSEIRLREQGTPIPAAAGNTLLGWPEMQLGQVAVVIATIFIEPKKYQFVKWVNQAYQTTEEAGYLYRAQYDAYVRLVEEAPEHFCLIRERSEFIEVMQRWEKNPPEYPERTQPTGLLLSMEGAEGISSPDEMVMWREKGVRLVGPVWAGTRFCGGTFEPVGGFSPEGLELLDVMADVGMILDVSHMNDRSAREALARFEGAIIASHANARKLLKDPSLERHLTDEAICELIERQGVIGVIPFSKFLKPGWTPSDPRDSVPLELLADQIDHICQLAGNASHVGIGTDFDGGFGWEQVPGEIDSIADMQKIVPILAARGYAEDDIAAIMGGNWRRFLEKHL